MTDLEALPPSTRKVVEAASALGLSIDPVVTAESARTAEEAAVAANCSVAEIVKSLVFKGRASGAPVLLLVSGANRVDQEAVAATIGEALDRPDGKYVRDITGFAIGGIPPFGHAQPMRVYLDKDLLVFQRVVAACGTPNSVFAVDPVRLVEVTGATVIAMQ